MRYLVKVLGLMTPLLVAVGPNRVVSADERNEAEANGPRRALHLAGLRHVPGGRENARRAGRAEPRDRADRLPRRLLQRPLEGRVLRPAVQPAADDLQPALHQAQERRVRALLHADADDRRRSSP